MQAGSRHYGVCPTCGQSLIDQEMRTRVERAQASAEKGLRATLRAEVEAEVTERLEARYAAERARAKARADELQRQLDTRSAHDRGIGHEYDVLASLKAAFPADSIERHGRGGDILHTVIDSGREVGLMLYECKNDGSWQSAWVDKLKRDGRKRGTPYLLLVSRTLPANAKGLCVRGDVVICEPAHVVTIAAVIRPCVVALYRADANAEDEPDKARRVYRYLAGEFRADFDVIMQCAAERDEQLAAERTSHERVWKRRAKNDDRDRIARLTIGAKLADALQENVASPPIVLPLEIPKLNRTPGVTPSGIPPAAPLRP